MRPFYQDPTLPQGFSHTFKKRFWSKVNKTDSCWLWTGAIDASGYGSICAGKMGQTVRAHVAAWLIMRGPIPKGMDVLHDCPGHDNKLCVLHLYLGGDKENGRDRALKGQSSRGEHRPNHKLTWPLIAIIRKSHETDRGLADRFGVSHQVICSVRNYKTWKAQ